MSNQAQNRNLSTVSWIQGVATVEDKKEFGVVWQERVEAIFDSMDKVITVKS